MKFSIAGFSQSALVSLGLSIVDAEILRWFVDFQGTGRMREFSREDGCRFYMVSYRAVIEDLPVIEVSSVSAVTRRFKKLADVGVLEHYHATIGGSFSCYRLGKKYLSLVSEPSSVSADPPAPALDPSGANAGPPQALALEQKTLLPITHLPDSEDPLTPAGGAVGASVKTSSASAEDGLRPTRFTHTTQMVNGYFLTWNRLGLPECRKLLVNVPNAGELLEALSYYSQDEVVSALEAYATVQQDPAYELGFRYQTVVSFLIKGLESFAPGAKPLEVYRARSAQGVESDDARVARLLAEAETIAQRNRMNREEAAS